MTLDTLRLCRKAMFNKYNPDILIKAKGTVHPCPGTEALYRPYGP
jgi:hypothetical protein